MPIVYCTPTNQILTLFVQKEMLQLFDTGKRREMLDLWVQYVPEKIRNEDSVAQKLEFYLHIYFAIYPLKFGEQVWNCSFLSVSSVSSTTKKEYQDKHRKLTQSDKTVTDVKLMLIFTGHREWHGII